MAKYLIEKAPNLLDNNEPNLEDILKKPRKDDK